MNDIHKAAIFLLSLDKALAAEILSQLPRKMVEAVTLEIAKLNDHVANGLVEIFLGKAVTHLCTSSNGSHCNCRKL